jgi:hypothetical protein
VEGVTRALILVVTLISLVADSFACGQTERPASMLGARSVNLCITNDGKPQRGSKFELHKAITFDREEARTTGAYERQSLGSATADSLGMLSFGEVKPGRYWIVTGESLSYSIAVEVTTPNANAPSQRLWLDYFADGCLDVVVENPN